MSIPLLIATWVSPLHDARNGDSCSGCRMRRGKSCKLFGRLKQHHTRKRDRARHQSCINADKRATLLEGTLGIQEDIS